LPAGITLTPIDQSRAEEWALVLAQVFSGQDKPPQWHIDIGLRSFAAQGGTAWAALHENRIIAAARSFIVETAVHLSRTAVQPAPTSNPPPETSAHKTASSSALPTTPPLTTPAPPKTTPNPAPPARAPPTAKASTSPTPAPSS